MNINSFSSAGVATAVWGNATRTITADPATDAGAATFVWTHAARTLTANPVTYTDFSATNSLAAGIVLDLRPAAGKHRSIVACDQNNNVSTLPGFYNGTTFTQLVNATVANIVQTMFGGSATGPALKNTAGSSINYSYMGFDQG